MPSLIKIKITWWCGHPVELSVRKLVVFHLHQFVEVFLVDLLECWTSLVDIPQTGVHDDDV